MTVTLLADDVVSDDFVLDYTPDEKKYSELMNAWKNRSQTQKNYELFDHQ